MQKTVRIAKITLCISQTEQNNSIQFYNAIFKDKQFILENNNIRINIIDIGKIKQVKTENQFHYEYICYCFENEIQYNINLIFETLKSKVEPMVQNFLEFRFNYNLLISKGVKPCQM